MCSLHWEIWESITPLTAGHDYFLFFCLYFFYCNFICQILNMQMLKRDMNQQNLKAVDLRSVQSE